MQIPLKIKIEQCNIIVKFALLKARYFIFVNKFTILKANTAARNIRFIHSLNDRLFFSLFLV